MDRTTALTLLAPKSESLLDIMQAYSEHTKPSKEIQKAFTLLLSSPAPATSVRSATYTDRATDIAKTLSTTFPSDRIELNGYWVWLTPSDRYSDSQYKKAGLSYSKNKDAWYWRPKGSGKRYKGKATREQIRKKYGTKDIIT